MSARRTVPGIVRAHLERDPGRELLRFRDPGHPAGDVALTLEALWGAAAGFAAALGPPPPGATPPVALLVLPLGPRLCAAHLGALLGGWVPVIHSHPSAKVAPEVYARNLAHVLAELAPPALVTDRPRQAALAAASGGRGPALLLEEDVPAAGAPEPAAWHDLAPDALALIQHSSGSTGLQKGVPLTHAMIVGQLEAYGRAIGLEPAADRVCSWLPLYHDMGLFTAWLLPLVTATPVAMIDPFAWVTRPASLLRLIHDRRGTLCWLPNFAFNLLAARADEDELAGLDLSCLRGVTNCSEPARAASHRALLERLSPHGLRADALWVCYAMAENAFAVTAAGGPRGPAQVLELDPGELSRDRAVARAGGAEVVSCGAPLAGCEVRVVDGRRAPRPEGHVGEVAIRSPFALREYHRNPEATAGAIDGAGWFHTGDLGFLRAGELYITGRKKDLLIVSGRNFYPQDLEALCDACPGAVPGRAVAVGVEDAALGTERIVVLVESRASGDAERRALAAAVRRRILDELDCPVSEVHVVPHMWLVKTSSGKLARRENLDRYRRELAPLARDPDAPSWLDSLAWSLVIASLLYLALALRANPSWGVYAGF